MADDETITKAEFVEFCAWFIEQERRGTLPLPSPDCPRFDMEETLRRMRQIVKYGDLPS
jgi:hypothetical protein